MLSIDCSFLCAHLAKTFSALRLNIAIWLEAICIVEPERGRRAINNNCENSIIKNYSVVEDVEAK